jgi:hypothetical protein
MKDAGRLVERQKLFINAALLAAHSSAPHGFRMRDVSFFIDLFQSWVETSIVPTVKRPERVQIKRLCESYTQQGLLKLLPRKARPEFKLTRPGLLQVLSELVDKQDLPKGPYFFFLYYFIKAYGNRIMNLFSDVGETIPYAYRLELERLTDAASLLKTEILRTEEGLRRIDRRISDAKNSAQLMVKELKSRSTLEDAILKVQSLYPYELNHQKPLSELIAEIPTDQRKWEMTDGNVQRIENIWEPERSLLLVYMKQLKGLVELT